MAATHQVGGEIKTELNSFPIPELSKVLIESAVNKSMDSNSVFWQAMNETMPEKIGQLVLPFNGSSEEKQPIPVLLGMKDLRHLHQIMFPSVV